MELLLTHRPRCCGDHSLTPTPAPLPPRCPVLLQTNFPAQEYRYEGIKSLKHLPPAQTAEELRKMFYIRGRSCTEQARIRPHTTLHEARTLPIRLGHLRSAVIIILHLLQVSKHVACDVHCRSAVSAALKGAAHGQQPSRAIAGRRV